MYMTATCGSWSLDWAPTITVVSRRQLAHGKDNTYPRTMLMRVQCWNNVLEHTSAVAPHSLASGNTACRINLDLSTHDNCTQKYTSHAVSPHHMQLTVTEGFSNKTGSRALRIPWKITVAHLASIQLLAQVLRGNTGRYRSHVPTRTQS